MGIGPFSQRGLDEAFGLAVGSGREGPGVAMSQTQLAAARIESPGAVASPVVGEYSPNSDAETTVVVGGCGEKGGRTGGGFVRVELREGDAGVVVDTDVDVFPSGALCTLSSVVGHPVTGPVEAAEFLDVEMQQVARVRVFIAADGRRRIEGAEAGNPRAAKHPTDGGGRDPEGGGNLRAGPAETAQRNDLDGDSRRQRPADTVWARTAVAQAVGALGLVAGHPLAHRAGTNPDGGGHRSRRLALVEDPPDNFGSTLRRQLGILMDVHSVLLLGNCVVDTVSFLGRVRVNNLLKDHT